MDQLYIELKKYGKVKTNVLLSKLSTFRIGGPAKYVVEVEESERLSELLNFLTGEGENFFILGGGSNMLFPDSGYEGVIVKIKTNQLRVEDANIIADAGVMLGLVLNTAVKNGLTGLEWAAGIPGTVGGAVRGNAGAMGVDTGKNISYVEAWQNREVVRFNLDECEFAYRESGFKNNKAVVLRACFGLKKGDQKEIMLALKKNIDGRTGKFPAFPSPGCFFKNVKLNKWTGDKSILPAQFIERGTVPVGWLADQVGAKGLVVGGAKVSDEHGNFIINFNNATQADVLAVVEEVKTRVYNKFKVELEPEVEIVY